MRPRRWQSTPQAGLGWGGRHQRRGSSRGWCHWMCLAAWVLEEFEAVSLGRDRRIRGKSGCYGNAPNGRVSGCQLLDCSAAPMLGVSGAANFCQVREGGGHCGNEGRKGSLRRGSRLFTDRPICSELPAPLSLRLVWDWDSKPPTRFWLPLEIERPLWRLRALPPEQLPCYRTFFEST